MLPNSELKDLLGTGFHLVNCIPKDWELGLLKGIYVSNGALEKQVTTEVMLAAKC